MIALFTSHDASFICINDLYKEFEVKYTEGNRGNNKTFWFPVFWFPVVVTTAKQRDRKKL